MKNLTLSLGSVFLTAIAQASPGSDHAHGPEGGATAVIVIVVVVIVGFIAFSMFSKNKK